MNDEEYGPGWFGPGWFQVEQAIAEREAALGEPIGAPEIQEWRQEAAFREAETYFAEALGEPVPVYKVAPSVTPVDPILKIRQALGITSEIEEAGGRYMAAGTGLSLLPIIAQAGQALLASGQIPGIITAVGGVVGGVRPGAVGGALAGGTVVGRARGMIHIRLPSGREVWIKTARRRRRGYGRRARGALDMDKLLQFALIKSIIR